MVEDIITIVSIVKGIIKDIIIIKDTIMDNLNFNTLVKDIAIIKDTTIINIPIIITIIKDAYSF